MGKIIIIDDCIGEAKLLEMELRKYLNDETIYIYDNYYTEVFDDTIDLVFLDIDLGTRNNGIKIAELLVNKNKSMHIIFVSNHAELVYNSLVVSPTFFVRKEFLEEDLQRAFRVLKLKKFRSIPILKLKNKDVKLDIIEYIESHDHYLTFHLIEEKDIIMKGKLEDYERIVEKHHFARCHKSYIVNLYYICSKEPKYVVLESDIKINITRNYYYSFNKKYHNYVVKNY